MSIHVALNHKTHYRYDRPVAHSPHVIRLRPAPHCRTPILSYSHRILPAKHFLNWQQEHPFNTLSGAPYVIPDKATESARRGGSCRRGCRSIIRSIFPRTRRLKNFHSNTGSGIEKEQATKFLEADPATPLLKEFVQSISLAETRTIDFLVQINQRLRGDIKYLIRMEPGVQSPETTLKLGSGSCRDSAWLFVQEVLRHLGLAARFVSGYLIQAQARREIARFGLFGRGNSISPICTPGRKFILPGARLDRFRPRRPACSQVKAHIPLACSPQPDRRTAPISGAVDEVRNRIHA